MVLSLFAGSGTRPDSHGADAGQPSYDGDRCPTGDPEIVNGLTVCRVSVDPPLTPIEQCDTIIETEKIVNRLEFARTAPTATDDVTGPSGRVQVKHLIVIGKGDEAVRQNRRLTAGWVNLEWQITTGSAT
jgi:hypothetical protein